MDQKNLYLPQEICCRVLIYFTYAKLVDKLQHLSYVETGAPLQLHTRQNCPAKKSIAESEDFGPLIAVL
jgi:hypothetical protein